MKNITFIILAIFMSSCQKNIMPPDAEKISYEMSAHGHKRIDNYYWMRLTDEQKSAKQYDDQTQQVVDYIDEENSYRENSLEHTKPFQKVLFDIYD